MTQEEKDKLYFLSLDLKTITDKMRELPLSNDQSELLKEITDANHTLYMTSIEVTTEK